MNRQEANNQPGECHFHSSLSVPVRRYIVVVFVAAAAADVDARHAYSMDNTVSTWSAGSHPQYSSGAFHGDGGDGVDIFDTLQVFYGHISTSIHIHVFNHYLQHLLQTGPFLKRNFTVLQGTISKN